MAWDRGSWLRSLPAPVSHLGYICKKQTKGQDCVFFCNKHTNGVVHRCTCWTPQSINEVRQWGKAALLRFSGACCDPLCTVLIFIPVDGLVILHKQYNNVGVVPGWPLHACTTHGDVAGSQAVAQLRGHTQHTDTRGVALGVRAHVDVGLHESTEVVQRVQGSQQLWGGDGEGRRSGQWLNGLMTRWYNTISQMWPSYQVI